MTPAQLRQNLETFGYDSDRVGRAISLLSDEDSDEHVHPSEAALILTGLALDGAQGPNGAELYMRLPVAHGSAPFNRRAMFGQGLADALSIPSALREVKEVRIFRRWPAASIELNDGSACQYGTVPAVVGETFRDSTCEFNYIFLASLASNLIRGQEHIGKQI